MNGYPHNVKVGDKLIVVDDSSFKCVDEDGYKWIEPCTLQKGQIVHVTDINGPVFPGSEAGPYFYIFELSQLDSMHHCRFKPVQKSKTDISIFNSILADPSKQLEETQ